MAAMKNKIDRETNPFEDVEVAEQWISSVEGEEGKIRDKEIYPLLRGWSSKVGSGVVVEIGSGQGICSQQFDDFNGEYIGVEPSEILTKRGKELYGSNTNFHFAVGNAYELPVESGSADGVFSVNVWFHLLNLKKASAELARILKKGGIFNIVTTNPASYELWETFFEDYTKEGKMISGKVKIPINALSRNDFYMHTMSEMTEALEDAGLKIVSVNTLGTMPKHPDSPLFISIEGCK